MQTTELLTLRETAERLRVSSATLRAWVRDYSLPVIRINAKAQRFDFDAVVQALRNKSDA